MLILTEESNLLSFLPLPYNAFLFYGVENNLEQLLLCHYELFIKEKIG